MFWTCPSRSVLSHTWTSAPGFGYGSGLRSTPRTNVKIAALTPTASASVATATAVNPGLRASHRTA
jgi:hypothetical protein